MDKNITKTKGAFKPENSMFDYVRQMAEVILPDIDHFTGEEGRDVVKRSPSVAPRIFCDRLNEGLVSMEERRCLYDEESDLQNMIKARNLDPDKLWALIVWLKDYVDSLHETVQESTREELMRIRQMLMRGAENGFELTIKVNGERAKSFSNRVVARYLCHLLDDFMTPAEKEKEREEQLELGLDPNRQPPDWSRRLVQGLWLWADECADKPLDAKYKYYIFWESLDSFLDSYPITKKVALITKETKFFISKLLYAVGLSDNEKFNQFEVDEDDARRDKPTKSFYINNRVNHLNGQISGVGKTIGEKNISSEIYGY